MQSTEVCVQVYNSAEAAHKKIIQNGYKFVENYIVTDYYFTHLNNQELKEVEYGKLMENTLLLRSITLNNKQTDYIIFKNKTLNSKNEVIFEEKMQTQIESLSNAKKMFNASGLKNWCRIQIEERDYVKGETTITLQNVPQLGVFIELEQKTNSNLSAQMLFQDLVYDANALGLDLGKDYSCKKNYMLFKKQFKM